MSEEKHTPGPWKHEGHGDITGTENGRKYDVACVYLRIPAGRQEANASLIAAAPDLLDALEFVMNRLVDKHEDDIAAQKARAAIAKATKAQT
jgi:hypothetical protein